MIQYMIKVLLWSLIIHIFMLDNSAIQRGCEGIQSMAYELLGFIIILLNTITFTFKVN